MKPALLLLDLQKDFLDRAGLDPPRDRLTARAASLLEACRARGLPVIHVHTVVRPDGGDRMPHWKRSDSWACVDGTPGALPPACLAPRPSESVFRKRFYGAFGAPELDARLRELGVTTLLLAGVYSHACVRVTALEAYERGYDVWIVDDAVGSTDPVHAELSRAWLGERAAHFLSIAEALELLAGDASEARADEPAGVACIDGEWRAADGSRRWIHRQPSDLRRTVAAVPLAERAPVVAAAASVKRAQPSWMRLPTRERLVLLEAVGKRLLAREGELVDLLVREIGKPRSEARAELRRARAHVDSVLRLASAGTEEGLPSPSELRVRYRPVGVVGLVTPWNNPVAIPVGKLAPALALGNGVVWKPASQASGTATALLELLHDAGVPKSIVALVFGEAETARHMISEPGIDAITVTGSIAAGRTAAALCAQQGKPLQAELGGNNAAIVLADADLAAEARGLALSAFAFAGQRCTATRRLLVEESVFESFAKTLVEAVEGLVVGDPDAADTQVGPMISADQRRRVADAVDAAVARGGRILCGGGVAQELEPGCYYRPTLVADLDPRDPLVQEETFGPVAVILPARNLDDAIRLANAVPQGLVASLSTPSVEARRRFADAIEAGILKLVPGPLAVDADAPFGGWKASGIGPPEHGIWDRQFYTQPQAVYGALDAEPSS